MKLYKVLSKLSLRLKHQMAVLVFGQTVFGRTLVSHLSSKPSSSLPIQYRNAAIGYSWPFLSVHVANALGMAQYHVRL
jgi:hypothetical protein